MKFKKGWQPVSMEGFLKACPICKNDGSDLCFDCKAEIGKSGFEPKGGVEPTNADRIRAMSDEEFAMWMAKKRVEEIVKVLGLAGVSVKLIESVEPVEKITDAKAKNILNWLKQPAEEG